MAKGAPPSRARTLFAGPGAGSMRRFATLAAAGKVAASRKAARPPLLSAAEAAYGDAIGPEGYELAHKTDTLSFFRKADNPNDVILGVRGSADKWDLVADAALAVGLLGASGRYKRDKAALAAFLKANPGAKITTAGHSLGGAVARRLARDFPAHIKAGVGYNAAIGLDELLSPSKLRRGKQIRYTTSKDFLHLLSKPFLRGVDRAKEIASAGGSNLLTAHKTSNFDATNLGV